MGVIAEGILKGCQGLFTPVSLGYPLSVFNKNSTLNPQPEPYDNPQRFDLWVWATYTDTQKVAKLLGSIPPRLDRQHEQAWVLLTFPTCTPLIYSIQSHTRLTQPHVFPSTSLPATPLRPWACLYVSLCSSYGRLVTGTSS